MKYRYAIVLVLILLQGIPLSLCAAAYAAAAVPESEPMQSAFGASVPASASIQSFDAESTKKQLKDLLRITWFNRIACIKYLKAEDTIPALQVANPDCKIKSGELKKEMDFLSECLDSIDTQSLDFMAELTRLEALDFKENFHTLLNDIVWAAYTLDANLSFWSSRVKNLSEVYPACLNLLEEELNIRKEAAELLLPFTSEAYRSDYETYQPQLVSTTSSKFNRRGDNMQIMTPDGIRVAFPLFKGRPVDVAMESTLKSNKRVMVFKFPSGFHIKLHNLTDDELGKFNDKICSELEEHKKAQLRLVRYLGISDRRDKQRAKNNAAKAEAMHSEVEESKLLEDLGIVDSLPKAMSKRAQKRTTKAAGKQPSAIAAATTPVDDARAAGMLSMAEREGGAATASARPPSEAVISADEEDRVFLRNITLDLAYRQLKDIKDRNMPERAIASKTGLNKIQKTTLAILLRHPLKDEGAIKPINTVVWGDLVGLLEGLGFHHASRDVFMNAENHRIHLHALHYDGYAINHKLLGILLTQLQYYKFPKETLIGLLD